jgi:hypothetical protein
MVTKIFTPLLGKKIRSTTLDSCGALPIVATPNAVIVTDGFITLSLSSEIEEGAEIITRKADGTLCVNEKRSDSFKRFTVEMEFCGVNPSLLSVVSNAKPYYGYGGTDVIGFSVPEGEIAKWFSLELWTGMTGGVCAPGAATASGYMLLPFLAAGVLGDIEITGEDAVNFSMTGAYTKGGNGWGVGPYQVVKSGSNEVQRITITGTPTGGTFTLTYSAQTTSAIPYNATAAQVQTALEALSNIGVGDVVVTGGPLPATAVTITFVGLLGATDAAAITATGTFTGGTTPTATGTTITPGVTGTASPLPTALDPFDHLLMVETSIAPPPNATTPIPMPA